MNFREIKSILNFKEKLEFKKLIDFIKLESVEINKNPFE